MLSDILPMNSDESIAYILQRDITDTMQLLAEGHEPFAICAAKLRNVLMIYKTTLPPDQYKDIIEYIVAESDNVPDLKDYAGLMNIPSMGVH